MLKRALSFVVFGIFSLVSVSFAEILSLPHKMVTLDNGMRVVLIQYPSPGVVEYHVAVHVGSRNEVETGKTGFAHFFEHLMFRGTKNRSAKDFGDLYTKTGAANNAFTSNDITNYHSTVSTKYLSDLLDAEADRFQNLYFEEKAFRDEAGAVLGEYNKNFANPSVQLEEKLYNTAFTTHPYSHTTMGFKEDIVQYPTRYQDVWPFFRRYYRPSNVSIILVGDVNLDTTLEMVKSKFGAWKDPQIAPVTIPQEPEQTEARFVEMKIQADTQVHAAVAFKVPGFTTQNREDAALGALSEIYLSKQSQFQKEFVFERAWLDSVEATPLESIDTGLWITHFRFTQSGSSHVNDVLKALDSLIAKIKSQPIDRVYLARAKKRFKSGALTSWFVSPYELALRLVWYTNFESDLSVIDRIFDRMEEVTPEDIQAFASKYLVDSHKTTVILRGEQS